MYSSTGSFSSSQMPSRPRMAFKTPPLTDYRDTQGAANNQIALGDRQAAKNIGPGGGISRGAGQSFLKANRGGEARANSMYDAMSARLGDAYSDAEAMAGYRDAAGSERLSYSNMNREFRNSERDSRFGNLTTIWGALSGLLR